MKLNPYLNFNGNAEEAMNFYKSVFGGEFSALQRFKEVPDSEQPMPESEGNRIMHVALPIGKDVVLMGSDISEKMGMKLNQGNNMYISLHPDTKEEAERLFQTLSEDGNIEMKFQKMFWGAWFASFTDKYGVQWMVNYEEKQK
ncbi:MAG: glyoxalase [Candidatus Buchananbacteria bacterium RIFCSPHIGHO2_02_FULL_39_17]|nr:MAG: glyoxalase [Candidatus Buchananbacteria bacterium RIFCSPHIGHO2_02_FULL_39_17]